ncbi:ATP-dependent endonuclease [Tropicimonas sp. IMCC34043]|uniref:ATP-dependent nuclease n=1 Tax=Tropicimonas sp. IMCC34043 TaxID=2248760 RepID=UPI0018E5667A|nr:AAA family ATPase [Tropicimonas sp. IMCC34043]
MFYVLNSLPIDAEPGDYVLIEDNWDDWFTYETKYHLYVRPLDGESGWKAIGPVKIGQVDMSRGQRRAAIPEQFENLDGEFFSLGQVESYYETAVGLGLADQLLRDLNDIAFDNQIFRKVRREDVTRVSLLRSVKEATVLGDFTRIISGSVPLTAYDFSYTGPQQLSSEHEPIQLDFKVEPGSNPPSNIHVLIGRNGIGKSFILNAMIRALVTNADDENEDGKFVDENLLAAEDNLFSAVISVTFSAFDKFEPLTDRQVTREGIIYAYVGLKNKRRNSKDDPGIKDLSALAREFSLSAQQCVSDGRLKRWQRALDMLESDPIFRITRISELADIEEIEEFKKIASSRFRNLSSGHKIVLLTITKLVELVRERSLVLLDEPEAHLHPPLLSAFVRALSDLLNNRNGVAIVATHSPVVLQEVPANCTWQLERHNTLMVAHRPEAETFAENVGILTHRVFGLEVEEAGFYNLIRDTVIEEGDYDEVMEKYGGQIGSEGRGLIRSLIALQNRKSKG